MSICLCVYVSSSLWLPLLSQLFDQKQHSYKQADPSNHNISNRQETVLRAKEVRLRNYKEFLAVELTDIVLYDI